MENLNTIQREALTQLLTARINDSECEIAAENLQLYLTTEVFVERPEMAENFEEAFDPDGDTVEEGLTLIQSWIEMVNERDENEEDDSNVTVEERDRLKEFARERELSISSLLAEYSESKNNYNNVEEYIDELEENRDWFFHSK